MMNFPINSASQNHKYFITPQKSAENITTPQISEPQNKKEPAGKNKKRIQESIWIGLGALAVLGTASILIYRAVKGKKQIPPVIESVNAGESDSVSKTNPKIIELKNKIKQDYLNRKSEILKTADLTVDEKDVEKYKTLRTTASSAVKDKLKNLAEDSDWVELRKMRKHLIKLLSTEKHGEKHDIASKKIELLNNVFVCKIYPDEQAGFKGKFLMDLSDAVELIKKDFTTFADFQKEFTEKQKYEFEIGLNDKFFFKNLKLTLRDLFPEEMKEYDYAKEKIVELNNEPKRKRQEKLKQLALEFREREDVKTLKKMNSSNN